MSRTFDGLPEITFRAVNEAIPDGAALRELDERIDALWQIEALRPHQLWVLADAGADAGLRVGDMLLDAGLRVGDMLLIEYPEDRRFYRRILRWVRYWSWRLTMRARPGFVVKVVDVDTEHGIITIDETQ